MGFRECVLRCATDCEFVERFNYLTGSSLSAPHSLLEALLDPSREVAVSAEQQEQLASFIMYVYSNVWRRLMRLSQRNKLLSRVLQDEIRSMEEAAREIAAAAAS